MIPVITVNNAGEYSYQVFNDNMSPAEVINRKLLHAIYYAQTALLGSENDWLSAVGGSFVNPPADFDDAKLKAINTAADTLLSSIQTAVAAFDEAIKQ